MTTPKGKGYRSIVVAGRRFKWRFRDRVVVVPDGVSGRQVLEIDFGWFDVWLYVDGRVPAPPPFSPDVPTPAFVAQGIQFALTNGWNTDVCGGRFVVRYSTPDGFRVALS